MSAKRRTARNQEWDVSLSFAREDRSYVAKVAARLRPKGTRVFYDEYEKVALWGKDLYQHLDDVCRNAARYRVLFISKSYAKRLWTNHERKSAQLGRSTRTMSTYCLRAVLLALSGDFPCTAEKTRSSFA